MHALIWRVDFLTVQICVAATELCVFGAVLRCCAFFVVRRGKMKNKNIQVNVWIMNLKDVMNYIHVPYF